MNVTEVTSFALRLLFCVYILPDNCGGMVVALTSSFFILVFCLFVSFSFLDNICSKIVRNFYLNFYTNFY